MKDPRSDFVVVTIDGEPYKVCLNNNALCEFEMVRGHSVGHVFASLMPGKVDDAERKVVESLSALDLRALVYAALKRYHNLTLEQAGELIHQGNFVSVLEAVQAAFVEFLPKSKDDSEVDPQQGVPK